MCQECLRKTYDELYILVYWRWIVHSVRLENKYAHFEEY